ncbi:Uncharacterized GMC-type oxidoreductase in thcA 5'region [Geodia barretti]|uniref:Uncharacterized GMC-type oxidoreductase in thcA 5'region n=1 Tax=Geodia barretti TaxID=519541 RepID=A0AA35W7R7_GEOBA|nr:Uncharacterized GMC-type oxidoreductase in thcA 5'region [Geodia barretti]
MGNNEWNFTNLLPYFRRIETDTDYGGDDFHGGDGPIVMHRFKRETWLPAQQAFYTAARAAGYPDCPDHNHPDTYGVGPTPLNNPNGIRISTAMGYLDQARHRLNLTIRPNCLVHRLIFEGNRATGVELESGGETFTVEGEEIILSAGAIGSPQILLLSGVGPADHLSSLGIPVVLNKPGVGQNLRDHPGVWVTWRTREGFELDEQPVLDYRYLEEEFDVRRLREAVRVCVDLGNDEAFKDIIQERVSPTDEDMESDEALTAWMRREVTTSQHISCTCKMGTADDPMAVVNQYGKVYGLEGLRIVDASIMPDCIRANTNVTTLAIGEKIADHIKEGK